MAVKDLLSLVAVGLVRDMKRVGNASLRNAEISLRQGVVSLDGESNHLLIEVAEDGGELSLAEGNPLAIEAGDVGLNELLQARDLAEDLLNAFTHVGVGDVSEGALSRELDESQLLGGLCERRKAV
jgi:hypothetical protein